MRSSRVGVGSRCVVLFAEHNMKLKSRIPTTFVRVPPRSKVDGKPIEGNMLPLFDDEAVHHVGSYSRMKYVSRSEALPVKLGPAGFFVLKTPVRENFA